MSAARGTAARELQANSCCACHASARLQSVHPDRQKSCRALPPQQCLGSALPATHPPVVMRHTLLAEVWLHQLHIAWETLYSRAAGEAVRQLAAALQACRARLRLSPTDALNAAQAGPARHPPGVPVEVSFPGPQHLADHHSNGHRQRYLW